FMEAGRSVFRRTADVRYAHARNPPALLARRQDPVEPGHPGADRLALLQGSVRRAGPVPQAASVALARAGFAVLPGRAELVGPVLAPTHEAPGAAGPGEYDVPGLLCRAVGQVRPREGAGAGHASQLHARRRHVRRTGRAD